MFWGRHVGLPLQDIISYVGANLCVRPLRYVGMLKNYVELHIYIYILKKTYCQVSTQIIVTICIVTIYQEGGIIKVLTYKNRQKK